MYQFLLIIKTSGSPYVQHIQTDANLLALYKSAIYGQAATIEWDKGIISVDTIVGMIDATPQPIDEGEF